MSLPTLTPGTLFAHRYQIVRCLAQGGMGAVYEVIHVETDRPRALKVMLPELLLNEDMRNRFRQEARVTARINSEYIVDVLDAGIDEATQIPFFVMELLNGEELEKRLARVKRLEPHEVVTCLYQAALALDKTHRASIVHRDLKPGNLMLTEREDGSPRIKVLDFGIAKLVAEGATGALATQPMGTPIYMAPEQIRLDQKLSPAVDIFALGMIAYTLLVGAPYWADEISKASNVYGLIGAVMQGPKEPASARAGRRGFALPPAFDTWFAKATALAPQDRFPVASGAIAALAEVFGIAVSQRSSTIPGAIVRSSSEPREPVRALEARAVAAGETSFPDPMTSSSVPTVPMRSSSLDASRSERSSLPAQPMGAAAFSTGAGMTASNPFIKRSPLRVLTVAIGVLVASVVVAAIALIARDPGPTAPEPSITAQETSTGEPSRAPASSPSGSSLASIAGTSSAPTVPSSSASAAVASSPSKSSAASIAKPPSVGVGISTGKSTTPKTSIKHD